MTKIVLRKNMDLGGGAQDWEVEIYAAKVQETLNKDVITWPDFKYTADWGVPTATKPKRNAMDFLNVTREFSISGYVEKESLIKPVSALSAPYVRDILNAMARYGGTCFLQYGVPSDTIGTPDIYPESDANKYYTNKGFSCHIRRIQWTEEPQDVGTYLANYKVPKVYSITISVVYAYDLSSS